MRVNDAVFGFATLFLAIALMVGSQFLTRIPAYPYGASFFPTVIGIVLVPFSVILILEGVKLRKEVPLLSMASWMYSGRKVINFSLFVLSIVFYVLFSEILGFVVTSIIMLTILFSWLWRRPIASPILAVAVTIVIHSLFYKLLLVPLPWGLLEIISW